MEKKKKPTKNWVIKERGKTENNCIYPWALLTTEFSWKIPSLPCSPSALCSAAASIWPCSAPSTALPSSRQEVSVGVKKSFCTGGWAQHRAVPCFPSCSWTCCAAGSSDRRSWGGMQCGRALANPKHGFSSSLLALQLGAGPARVPLCREMERDEHHHLSHFLPTRSDRSALQRVCADRSVSVYWQAGAGTKALCALWEALSAFLPSSACLQCCPPMPRPSVVPGCALSHVRRVTLTAMGSLCEFPLCCSFPALLLCFSAGPGCISYLWGTASSVCSAGLWVLPCPSWGRAGLWVSAEPRLRLAALASSSALGGGRSPLNQLLLSISRV